MGKQSQGAVVHDDVPLTFCPLWVSVFPTLPPTILYCLCWLCRVLPCPLAPTDTAATVVSGGAQYSTCSCISHSGMSYQLLLQLVVSGCTMNVGEEEAAAGTFLQFHHPHHQIITNHLKVNHLPTSIVVPGEGIAILLILMQARV